MISVCCYQEVRWRGQGSGDGGKKGDVSYGGLEREIKMVVWKIWCRSCVRRW